MAEDTFGARLKQLRERAGLTQEQLAGRVGMDGPSLAKLEEDLYTPIWLTVRALARALGVSCAAFEDTVEPPPRQAAPPGRKRKGRQKGSKD